jgi:hypothetical protein
MIDENDMNEEQIDAIESLGIKAMHYNSIVDRYFTKFYVDEMTDKEQFIFIHTNGVIMCGLGKNHYIVKSGLKIKEIKDQNKMSKISGKRKHGAHLLFDNENILQFILEGENSECKEFSFCPKVRGKLIEINQNIFNKPQVVQESPEKFGYLCFLLMIDARSVEVLREKLEKAKLNK